MYVAKFPTALCSLDKTPTRDILKFRQATWDTPLAGPHGAFGTCFWDNGLSSTKYQLSKFLTTSLKCGIVLSNNINIIMNQVPVVQSVDNAIHQINHYSVDKCCQNKLDYPPDSDLSGGWHYPLLKQLGPGKQGCRSGESTPFHQCGPGLIPGRGVLWVEFVVVSCHCFKSFSPDSPVFLPPQKPTLITKFQFNWKQWMKKLSVEMPLQNKFSFYFTEALPQGPNF